jgi:hypothetical protein
MLAKRPEKAGRPLIRVQGGREKTHYHRAIGAIAQLGERLLCKQEVAGSIPAGST